MIVTRTNSMEGKKIAEYHGIVFGKVISGMNMFNDRDRQPMKKNHKEQEMKVRVQKMGANNRMMISASRTVVTFE